MKKNYLNIKLTIILLNIFEFGFGFGFGLSLVVVSLTSFLIQHSSIINPNSISEKGQTSNLAVDPNPSRQYLKSKKIISFIIDIILLFVI